MPGRLHSPRRNTRGAIAPRLTTGWRHKLATGAAAVLVIGASVIFGQRALSASVTSPPVDAPVAEQIAIAGAAEAAAIGSLRSQSEVTPLQATALELELFERVNAHRAAHHLPPVQLDVELLEIARVRAGDQVTLPSLSHYDHRGRLVFAALLDAAGADYRLAGENLARLHGPEDAAAERADQALMNSPTHRANILERSFNYLAVGAAFDPSGRIIFAQIFRAR